MPQDHRDLRSNRWPWVISGIIVLLVTLLHYGTHMSSVHYHTLYRELYLLPIIVMSLHGGTRLGLATTLVIGIIYLPHVYMTWSAQPGVNFGNIVQVFVFFAVAWVTGQLADREREYHRKALESERLASLGRVALAISQELKWISDGLKTIKKNLTGDQEKTFSSDIDDILSRIHVLESTSMAHMPDSPSTSCEYTEIHSFLTALREKFSGILGNRGVKLDLDLDESGCFVNIPEKDLHWILVELLTNAVANSEPGSTVHLACRREKDTCRIVLKDQGRGMDQETLDKIFVPFFSTKPDGSGLGLPVTRKMIEDRGGHIDVESQPGEGTTFSISLPQAHRDCDPARNYRDRVVEASKRL